MCRRTSVADLRKGAVGDLPPSYREALESVAERASQPPLSTLSDAAHLELVKEIRRNFYDRKAEWTGGRWSRAEADLYRLAGAAADGAAGMGRFTLASVVGDYLTTLTDSLERKIGGAGDSANKQPDLLSKKRHVSVDGFTSEVHGPVTLGAMYPGNSMEVWTSAANPDEGSDDATQESLEESEEKVAVVLGAGNQNFLTLIDVLEQALHHRRPVLLKHHPLRPWLSHPFGIILEPLTRRGYFAQVPDAGVGATKALLSDPAVGHVHLTGALKTAEAVMDTLALARPELTEAQIKAMVTSELGCATPQILDDGVYTDAEIRHACQMIAFGKKANGGCNCLAAQVVVLPKHWPQKNAFRSKLLEELKRQPTTPCYYPGSKERKVEMIGRCEKVTQTVADSVSEETKINEADQVVVVECGTPGEEGYNPTPLLYEAFGPLLAIVELDGHDGEGDEDEYLAERAVPFLNDKDNIFGSLSCSIFTPASKGDTHARKGLRSALSKLQYGAICVNQCNIFGYFTALKGGMWGGHASEARGQSGNGLIGDLYGIIGKRSAKSVVYAKLESKPLFDLANTPPPVVLDVLMELTCTSSIFKGVIGAIKLIIAKSVSGIMSCVGLPVGKVQTYMAASRKRMFG